MVRRDLMDFYGQQLNRAVEAAAWCGNNRPDLMSKWEREGSVRRGFADHMMLSSPDMPEVAWEIAYFAIGWLACGLPRLVLSHKLSASLAATSIPEEFHSTIEAPWNWFVVVVPKGVFYNSEDSTLLVRPVDLEEGGRGLRLRYQHWSSPECINRGGKPVAEMAVTAPLSEFAQPDDVLRLRELDGELQRSLALHAQLVFGCMVELQGNESLGQARRGVAEGIRRGPPKAWNLCISRPVRCDVRSHCRDYLAGSGKKLSKQFMVRGYWRRQPYGPGGELRRFQHIEPYWRGPEDAPIAVRPHVLKHRG